MGWRTAILGALLLLRPLAAQDGRWQWGVELRSRSEAASGDADTLTRLRVSTQFDVSDWLRVHAEFQDARSVASPDDVNDNPADVRYAWAEFGPRDSAAWRLRVGRQPLAFGSERLLTADDGWCNRGQRFDGVRATLTRRHWQWDLFMASVAPVLRGRLDPVRWGDRISGIYGNWKRERAHASVEPYLLLQNVRGQRQLWTPGVRAARKLAAGFTASSETAVQWGTAGGLPQRAWAGAWEIAHPLGGGPQVRIGYSHASGGPGRTFNDLRPSAFNGCGFRTPFPWRNIRDLYAAADWALGRKWQLMAESHQYWLASLSDGVYVDEGPYLHFDPAASSTRLGMHHNVALRYKASAHWDLAAGYARFMAGPYLSNAAPPHGGVLSWTWTL